MEGDVYLAIVSQMITAMALADRTAPALAWRVDRVPAG